MSDTIVSPGTIAVCIVLDLSPEQFDEVVDRLQFDTTIPRRELGPNMPGWSAAYLPSLGVSFAVKTGRILTWREFRKIAAGKLDNADHGPLH